MKIGNIAEKFFISFERLENYNESFRKDVTFRKEFQKRILKVTKILCFTLSSEDIFFEKPQGGVKLTPSPPPFRVKNTFLIQYVRF